MAVQVAYKKQSICNAMKRDPYKHKERWLEWKEETKKGIPEISKANSDLILAYLSDMEMGRNRGKGSIKGGRAPNRLNDIRSKMIFFSKKFEERFKITDLTKITEEQAFTFFTEMTNGTIKNQKNGIYKGVTTFARDFKAFWNWYSKVNRKKGITIPDIVEDLNSRPNEESQFVYLNKEEISRLINSVKFEYKVLISFLIDTGLRAPTELTNIKISDLSNDCKTLVIRQEIVKRGSFGRTIQLTKSPELLRTYIKSKKLEGDEFLFTLTSTSANKYLQRHAKDLFGTSMTKGGQQYHKLSLYDFRHIACCYWSKILNKDRDIMQRFGWKQSNKIYYYSKFIDDEEKESLVIDTETSELQRRLELTEKDKSNLEEKYQNLETKYVEIAEIVKELKSMFKSQQVQQSVQAT